MKLTINIKRLSRSPNRFSGVNYWQQYTSERKKWMSELAVTLWPVAHKNPKTYCYVTVHRYSSKPMDNDNLAASCKPMLDGLKDLGFIIDDSPLWIHFNCEWRQGRIKHGFTRIILDYNNAKTL